MTKEKTSYFDSIKKPTEIDIRCPMCGQENRFDVLRATGLIQCDSCSAPLRHEVEMALQEQPEIVNAVQRAEALTKEALADKEKFIAGEKEAEAELSDEPIMKMEPPEPITESEVELFKGKPKGKGKKNAG